MRKLYLVLMSIISFFAFFAGTIHLNSLFNYSNQSIPNYINKDNTPLLNPITDEGATLGRVLFYDKNLSATNTISCASCHKQAFAFGDSDIQSVGHEGGLTGRHSMRLSNARFSQEGKFFWDERANTLEEQTTQPIQDHIEMGFSGTNGDPGIDDLIAKLENIEYYDPLFTMAFGIETITEERIQLALAQFVRSMQSFDSKYDVGRAQVGNNNANFPNFTTAENNGKRLFMSNNGAACNRCHVAPEFDIDPNSRNNGVIGVAGSPGSIDVTNTRSPSLRDVVNSSGIENGPFMHDGSLSTLLEVINHYDAIPNNPNNTNLDNRLQGRGSNLDLNNTEKNELLAFLNTLSGSNLYTDAKWSDPFDTNGDIEIVQGILPVELTYFDATQVDKSVQLEWETAAELNNEGFDILHSQNAVDWSVLDFVPAKNINTLYEYLHLDPVIGANFYRLKQIDLDGQFSLSDIKVVRLENTQEEITVYPNPTTGIVNITDSSAVESAYIYNVSGQLVKHINTHGSTKIDLSNLSSGTYFISFTSTLKMNTQVQRIIKL